MKKNAYFISGLGAQCRIFDKIILPDNYIRHNLEFFNPEINDDLRSYALRLGKDIERDSVVIGLSLGGMMAVEIAKERKDITAVLLSSIPIKKEFPFYLTGLLNIRAHRLINNYLLKNIFPFITSTFITSSKNIDAKKLLVDMLLQNDVDLYKWFIEAIKLWNNDVYPENIIRIHGTSDKVLPIYDKKKIDCIIQGGTHVMLLDKYDEINEFLKKKL